MTFIHGKDTVVTLNAIDLSAYTKSTDFKKDADVHDVTTYGKTWHVFFGGLKNGSATMTGIYDNSLVGGPRAICEPLVGQTVVWVFRPEGTGSGKAQSSGNVVVKSYNESSPSDDMVSWTCELQFSDTMNSTPQS